MLLQLGIPVSEGSLLVSNEDKFVLHHSTDGVDPLEIEDFVGQDHYDCARFANGGFGAAQQQLDCAKIG